VFVQCGHFADKGVGIFRWGRIFWCKNFRYFEIYDLSAWTRGVEPVRSRGSIFFAILCGRLLWTVPYF